MPIFEFECENGHIFEKYFKTNVPDLSKFIKEGHCKICYGKIMRKIQSTVSEPIFRGVGFYATDYKKGENKK